MLLVTRKFEMAICATAVAIFLAACGGPADRIKERESQLAATPTPTPGERPIAGSLRVEGTFPNDSQPYSGSLTVTPKGDNYDFRWTTTKGTRVGTGVQMGNVVAVSFAPTGGGKGCGVVLYKVDTINGILDGRRAIWGEGTYATERATRTEGNGFPGTYNFTDSEDRAGKLTISKDGSGYSFVWLQDGGDNAKARLPAFGLWHGSYAAASFGGYQCGFALYDIQSNGGLEGDWGGQKQLSFGKESAKIQ